MIKVILSGCNGKMGQVITGLVQESEDMQIVCGVDINAVPKNDYPVVTSPSDFSGEADVIIDFSHPSSLDNLLAYAVQSKTPIVVCTTGLASDQIKKMHETANDVAVFFSANMSLGINLMIDLITRAAKILEESFDIEIVERHHNQKIDAPSGTALALADALAESLSEPTEYVYDRHSVRRKRKKREIGLHAVRGGTIVGDHTVIFAGKDEVIEVKHSAASKEVFAVGAVRAGRFLADKPAGMYSMRDLVGAITD